MSFPLAVFPKGKTFASKAIKWKFYQLYAHVQPEHFFPAPYEPFRFFLFVCFSPEIPSREGFHPFGQRKSLRVIINPIKNFPKLDLLLTDRTRTENGMRNMGTCCGRGGHSCGFGRTGRTHWERVGHGRGTRNGTKDAATCWRQARWPALCSVSLAHFRSRRTWGYLTSWRKQIFYRFHIYFAQVKSIRIN